MKSSKPAGMESTNLMSRVNTNPFQNLDEMTVQPPPILPESTATLVHAIEFTVYCLVGISLCNMVWLAVYLIRKKRKSVWDKMWKVIVSHIEEEHHLDCDNHGHHQPEASYHQQQAQQQLQLEQLQQTRQQNQEQQVRRHGKRFSPRHDEDFGQLQRDKNQDNPQAVQKQSSEHPRGTSSEGAIPTLASGISAVSQLVMGTSSSSGGGDRSSIIADLKKPLLTINVDEDPSNASGAIASEINASNLSVAGGSPSRPSNVGSDPFARSTSTPSSPVPTGVGKNKPVPNGDAENKLSPKSVGKEYDPNESVVLTNRDKMIREMKLKNKQRATLAHDILSNVSGSSSDDCHDDIEEFDENFANSSEEDQEIIEEVIEVMDENGNVVDNVPIANVMQDSDGRLSALPPSALGPLRPSSFDTSPNTTFGGLGSGLQTPGSSSSTYGGTIPNISLLGGPIPSTKPTLSALNIFGSGSHLNPSNRHTMTMASAMPITPGGRKTTMIAGGLIPGIPAGGSALHHTTIPEQMMSIPPLPQQVMSLPPQGLTTVSQRPEDIIRCGSQKPRIPKNSLSGKPPRAESTIPRAFHAAESKPMGSLGMGQTIVPGMAKFGVSAYGMNQSMAGMSQVGIANMSQQQQQQYLVLQQQMSKMQMQSRRGIISPVLVQLLSGQKPIYPRRGPERPWHVELGLNSTHRARKKWFGSSRMDPPSLFLPCKSADRKMAKKVHTLVRRTHVLARMTQTDLSGPQSSTMSPGDGETEQNDDDDDEEGGGKNQGAEKGMDGSDSAVMNARPFALVDMDSNSSNKNTREDLSSQIGENSIDRTMVNGNLRIDGVIPGMGMSVSRNNLRPASAGVATSGSSDPSDADFSQYRIDTGSSGTSASNTGEPLQPTSSYPGYERKSPTNKDLPPIVAALTGSRPEAITRRSATKLKEETFVETARKNSLTSIKKLLTQPLFTGEEKSPRASNSAPSPIVPEQSSSFPFLPDSLPSVIPNPFSSFSGASTAVKPTPEISTPVTGASLRHGQDEDRNKDQKHPFRQSSAIFAQTTRLWENATDAVKGASDAFFGKEVDENHREVLHDILVEKAIINTAPKEALGNTNFANTIFPPNQSMSFVSNASISGNRHSMSMVTGSMRPGNMRASMNSGRMPKSNAQGLTQGVTKQLTMGIKKKSSADATLLTPLPSIDGSKPVSREPTKSRSKSRSNLVEAAAAKLQKEVLASKPSVAMRSSIVMNRNIGIDKSAGINMRTGSGGSISMGSGSVLRGGGLQSQTMDPQFFQNQVNERLSTVEDHLRHSGEHIGGTAGNPRCDPYKHGGSAASLGQCSAAAQWPQFGAHMSGLMDTSHEGQRTMGLIPEDAISDGPGSTIQPSEEENQIGKTETQPDASKDVKDSDGISRIGKRKSMDDKGHRGSAAESVKRGSSSSSSSSADDFSSDTRSGATSLANSTALGGSQTCLRPTTYGYGEGFRPTTFGGGPPLGMGISGIEGISGFGPPSGLGQTQFTQSLEERRVLAHVPNAMQRERYFNISFTDLLQGELWLKTNNRLPFPKQVAPGPPYMPPPRTNPSEIADIDGVLFIPNPILQDVLPDDTDSEEVESGGPGGSESGSSARGNAGDKDSGGSSARHKNDLENTTREGPSVHVAFRKTSVLEDILTCSMKSRSKGDEIADGGAEGIKITKDKRVLKTNTYDTNRKKAKKGKDETDDKTGTNKKKKLGSSGEDDDHSIEGLSQLEFGLHKSDPIVDELDASLIAWQSDKIKFGAWPLWSDSTYESVGEASVFELCRAFVRFTYMKNKSMTHWCLGYKIFLGCLPSVKSVALGVVVKALTSIVEIQRRRFSEAERAEAAAAKSVPVANTTRFDSTGTTIDSLGTTGMEANVFAQMNAEKPDYYVKSSHRIASSVASYYPSTVVPEVASINIWDDISNSRLWTNPGTVLQEKFTNLFLNATDDDLAVAMDVFILQFLLGGLLLKGLPMIESVVFYQFEEDLPQNGWRHNMRQVVMTQLLGARVEKRREEWRQKLEMISKNEGFSDVFPNPNEQDSGGSPDDIENLDSSIMNVKSAVEKLNSEGVAGNANENGNASVEKPSIAAPADEKIQKKHFHLDPQNNPFLREVPPLPAFQNSPGKCQTLLESINDDCVNTVWGKTFTLFEACVKACSTLYVVVFSLWNSTLQQTADERELNNARTHATSITASSTARPTSSSTSPSVSFTTSTSDLFRQELARNLNPLDSCSDENSFLWFLCPKDSPALAVFCFLAFILFAQTINYRMRYHDGIEFWSVSYKWRVNIGSFASEMLRETPENGEVEAMMTALKEQDMIPDEHEHEMPLLCDPNLHQPTDDIQQHGSGNPGDRRGKTDTEKDTHDPRASASDHHDPKVSKSTDYHDPRASVDSKIGLSGEGRRVDSTDPLDCTDKQRLSNKSDRQFQMLRKRHNENKEKVFKALLSADSQLFKERSLAYAQASQVFRRRSFHAFFVQLITKSTVGLFQAFCELCLIIILGLEVVKLRLSIGSFVTALTAMNSLLQAVTSVFSYFDTLPQGYSALLWIAQAMNGRIDRRKAYAERRN